MTSMNDSEFPSSPQNNESGEEEQDSIKQEEDEEDEPPQSNVASILARLQSSGALLKKPKQEYRCFPCDNDFSNWQDLEKHIITHVSLPSVVVDKLPSDEEDLPPSGDENWSDEDEDQSPPKSNMAKTPQKIDISQILKKTGLSLKKTPSENNLSSSDSALNKLSGLGFTIKKNITPIKKEKIDNEENDNMMQKLGKLGGIKLKLKSDGNNTNSFKVVNGLKDFKTSDDEDDGSANEDDKEDQDFDEDMDKSGENDGSEGEQDSDDQQNNRNQSGNSDLEALKRKIPNLHTAIQGKVITQKKEPSSTPLKVTPIKIQKDVQVKPVNSRPVVKQTPKRGVIVPIASKENQQLNETLTSRRPSQTSTPDTPRRPSQTPTPDTPRRPSQTPTPDSSQRLSQTNTPERPLLNDRIENVVVKQEPQASSGDTQNNIPLFSGPIKAERSTPPLSERTTPILAHVKPEPEVSSTSSTQPLFSYQNSHSVNTSTAITSHTNTLLPVTKTEDTGMTVIEINGDSNDEDDDCCVVSTTPASDVKPIVPKDEKPTLPPPYSATPSYTKSQTLYNSAPASSSRSLSSATSTEKQHNFNWNAPDSKPPLNFLEKSTDDIFESLLSSSTKKENMSLSEASEYISLDTLGPQHSCDVCNTRFTDVSLLEEHIRMTGHSKSIVARTSSLMPYDPSSSNLLLSSLLPVKQIAEQVGKLSTTSNSGPGFTHQQNVMINIQAYPGGGGVMVPPQYNSYNSGQGTHGNYPQTSGNMYGTQPMTMPNQYPGTNFMPPGYGQYQPPMSKPGYPGTMPHNSFSMSSPQYSTASPLQSMQQAVYGQSMMNPAGSMGPPGSSPNHSYASTSSPGGLKQSSSGIKIQNVQTFPPGQMPGQTQPGHQMSSGAELGIGQMAPPSQTITGQVQGGTPIRMAAGANISGMRPRMPSVRGQRPTIRPGIQVHGQVRGAKMGGPRMPLKRSGAMAGGPAQKRRSDMLLPGKHDNEDCQVMALQKQREGLPLIQSVQGAKDKLNLGSHISITKKPVNKEANAMANVLASRGISVKQKQKSRSPTPERPLPHIPNLGAGMSIKHTSRSSKFSIPEAKVGGGMYSCKICKKMFMNHNSLQVHISNAHPQSKIPVFKCDECPASYPKSLQLQHHKRVFHNVTGPNRELGLPVVDLSQEDNLKRLSSLGIYSFIPLANREQGNGCFGIPVISVHNMQNGLTSGLQALGADGLLSLGPLKPLPNS